MGVFTNRTHTKRSVEAGVVHHGRWASSPIARTDRVPLKPASFTTEGGRLHQSSSTCYGRLHQFVVHMLWASSPVRRPHAMGVFTSSSSTCYGRRHQFVVHMLWASSPVRQHLSDARTRAVRILSTVRAHPTLRLQVRLTHQSVSSPHTTCGPSLSSIR